MKKIFLATIILSSVFACQQRDTRSAGEQAKVSASKQAAIDADTTNFTTIQWIDSLTKNLGTVKEGPQIEVTYHFKNTGDKPLIIEDVSASCGCTVPEKPEKPFAPGEEGDIKAKFNTEGRSGTNHKTITVKANTKGTQTHMLEFQVEVEKK